MTAFAAVMVIHIAGHTELDNTGVLPTSACCAGTIHRPLTWAQAPDGRTAAAHRHLLEDVDELISDLTDTSQLDVSNTTSPFGLEVYGSGQATGLIADSGSTEVWDVHVHVSSCLWTVLCSCCNHSNKEPLQPHVAACSAAVWTLSIVALFCSIHPL